MSLLKLTEPEGASGDLAGLYDDMNKNIGFVPNGYKLLGVSIDVLKKHMKYAEWVFKHPTLSAKFSAVMRMIISENVHCEYCININAAMLQNQHGMSADEIDALKTDINTAPLKKEEIALLKFVLSALDNSESATAEDILALQNHGWADHEIIDALYQGTQQVAIDTVLNTFKVENDLGE